MGIFCLEFEADIPHLTLQPWKACVWPGSLNLVRDTPQELLKQTLFSGQSCYFDAKIDFQLELSHWIPSINNDVPSDNEKECLVLDDGISSLSLDKDKDINLVGISKSILDKNKIMDTLSEQLIDLLQKSIKKRTCNLPEPHTFSEEDHPIATNAKLAILFSGGLDSTVLAALADRYQIYYAIL